MSVPPLPVRVDDRSAKVALFPIADQQLNN